MICFKLLNYYCILLKLKITQSDEPKIMMHISYYFESNLHVNQLIAKCQKITFPIAYSPPALQWVSNKNDPNQKHKTLVTCKNEQP